jgi:hypothetical protein
MSRKLLLAAYSIVCFAAFRSPAAEYVISAGDITSLTNLIGEMGNNIRLEPGIYDLRPLTNAPMYTSEYYGKSLLNLGKWTKLSGISPNAADTVLIGASPFRILHGTGVNAVSNITFTGGCLTNTGAACSGGAVRLEYADNTRSIIRNCRFLHNHCERSGGAVNGEMDIIDSYFYGNTSNSGGGAGSGGYWHGCNVESNAVIRYAYGGGGGISGAKLIDGCTIVSNSSSYCGGGISSCSNVMNSVISFNACDGVQIYARGGGVWDSYTITNCIVEYNRAGGVAGGYAHGIGKTSAIGCRFTLNGSTANGDSQNSDFIGCEFIGNGLYTARLVQNCRIYGISNTVHMIDNVRYGPAELSPGYVFTDVGTIRNSLITECSILRDSNPACFYSAGTSLLVENCTIADNFFTFTLRGFKEYAAKTSNVVFVNTVFSNNRRGQNEVLDLTGYEAGRYALTNCMLGVRHLTQAEGFSDSCTRELGAGWNPKFAGEGEHPYTPKRSSPLQGRGIRLDWMGVDTVDLAGLARITQGRVDIGCYQQQLPPFGAYILVR